MDSETCRCFSNSLRSSNISISEWITFGINEYSPTISEDVDEPDSEEASLAGYSLTELLLEEEDIGTIESKVMMLEMF